MRESRVPDTFPGPGVFNGCGWRCSLSRRAEAAKGVASNQTPEFAFFAASRELVHRFSIAGTLTGGDHRSCFAPPGRLHPRARIFPGIPVHRPRPLRGGGFEEERCEYPTCGRGNPRSLPPWRYPHGPLLGRSRRRTGYGSSRAIPIPALHPGRGGGGGRAGWGTEKSAMGGGDEGQIWPVSLESLH